MDNNEARRVALNRAKKNMGVLPKVSDVELYEEEMPKIIVSEDQSSQFSQSNLNQGEDVVVYTKICTYHPDAIKNFNAAGKNILDDVKTFKGVFIICNKNDAGDIVKTLIEDSIGISPKTEEKE